MYQPLADRLRPNSIDEVVGQRHILGEQGVLRRIIQGGNIPNLIFYGPSGTGKTTVAEIAAAQMHRPFHRLNATTASSGHQGHHRGCGDSAGTGGGGAVSG